MNKNQSRFEFLLNQVLRLQAIEEKIKWNNIDNANPFNEKLLKLINDRLGCIELELSMVDWNKESL